MFSELKAYRSAIRPSSAGRLKLETAAFTSDHAGFFIGGFVDLSDFVEAMSVAAYSVIFGSYVAFMGN